MNESLYLRQRQLRTYIFSYLSVLAVTCFQQPCGVVVLRRCLWFGSTDESSKILVIRGQAAKTVAELKSTVKSTGNGHPDSRGFMC